MIFLYQELFLLQEIYINIKYIYFSISEILDFFVIKI